MKNKSNIIRKKDLMIVPDTNEGDAFPVFDFLNNIKKILLLTRLQRGERGKVKKEKIKFKTIIGYGFFKHYQWDLASD
jgi:hypothetical protein